MNSLSSLFLRHVAQTGPLPAMLEVDHGRGIFLYDVSGKQFVDLNSGYCVSALGHCHPRVVEAVQQQAARYMHTSAYGEHIQSPQVRLAEALNGTLDPGLDCIYFVNSGSEAIEGAMKLAKRITGRPEIIACYNAYHGSTQGADSLRADLEYISAFMPLLPGIRHMHFGNTADLDVINASTAAVIVEPIQGEAGVRLPPPGYLQMLRDKCAATGSLLIFDEIQTGMGRTGNMYAHQGLDVVPDILLLAKALGGGMPLGAIISRKSYLDAFTVQPELGHLTTFGGHPVCCAAGLAALQELQEGGYLASVAEKGARFASGLKHPAIREIRHVGLMIGVELQHAIDVNAFVRKAHSHGLITDQFLFAAHTFRIAPPLIITEEQIDAICDTIHQVLDEMTNP